MPLEVPSAGPKEALPGGSLFDALLIRTLCFIGAVGASFLLAVPTIYSPAEDAIILFQFSRNLAQTGAITYFKGGPHAEGATDFAWMVLISAAFRLGIPPFWAVAVLNFLCMFLLAYLLLHCAGQRLTWVKTLFVFGIFAVMPQFWSSAAGFSTLLFSCILTALACCVLSQQDVKAAVLALALCLLRPDGVVFAVPLLVAAVLAYSGRRNRLLWDALLFLIPGIGYFLWRWHYFGEFLPLPFLVKSDTERLGHYLVLDSLKEARPLLFFTFVVLIAALRGLWGQVKNRIVLVCMILLPTAFYLGMRLDQNVGLRFFIYLPLATGLLIALNWDALAIRRWYILRTAAAAWLLFVFATSFRQGHASKQGQFVNRKDVSVALSGVPHGTLLTTEAGIAPYYSGWKSYDSWGLSTAQFAHHLIQPSEVAALAPDVVLIHYGSGINPQCIQRQGWEVPYKDRTWDTMVRNMVAGADPQQYDLWMVPRGLTAKSSGQPALALDMDCWLVRKSSPQRSVVENLLQEHEAMPGSEYYFFFPQGYEEVPQATKPGTAHNRWSALARTLWGYL